MPRSARKLLEVAGGGLTTSRPRLPPELAARAGSLAGELLEMLLERNGFYAFESALHVFPAGPASGETDLSTWNAELGWRSAYDGLADSGLFFAEDVFGGQFVIGPDGISHFDPETAERDGVAKDIDGWAGAILSDFEVLTGYPLAHEWQLRHGPIPPGKRLVPKLPFVLGGEYSIANLRLADATEGMRFRGSLATQIRDRPDGSKIRIELVE